MSKLTCPYCNGENYSDQLSTTINEMSEHRCQICGKMFDYIVEPPLEYYYSSKCKPDMHDFDEYGFCKNCRKYKSTGE